MATEEGNNVGEAMRNGDFVARDLVVDLVVKAIIIQDAAAGTLTNDTIEGYFVTGFPRDLDQAHHFKSRVRKSMSQI